MRLCRTGARHQNQHQTFSGLPIRLCRLVGSQLLHCILPSLCTCCLQPRPVPGHHCHPRGAGGAARVWRGMRPGGKLWELTES